MKRISLIAGNWKMHTTIPEACLLAAEVSKFCTDLEDREVLVAPPATSISEVVHVLKNSDVQVGAQNVCWEEQGAFTGEISPVMLKECGASAAIIGHSERRQIFGEKDALINKRVKGTLSHGLTAILCVGETLEERETDKTYEVLTTQVTQGLLEVDSSQAKNLVIAYEPVWAIGTGKTATKDQAQKAHKFIRELIATIFEKNIAENTRILYGGSVKPSNVDELMQQPDIDGALVGGAALDAESFGRIIQYKS